MQIFLWSKDSLYRLAVKGSPLQSCFSLTHPSIHPSTYLAIVCRAKVRRRAAATCTSAPSSGPSHSDSSTNASLPLITPPATHAQSHHKLHIVPQPFLPPPRYARIAPLKKTRRGGENQFKLCSRGRIAVRFSVSLIMSIL